MDPPHGHLGRRRMEQRNMQGANAPTEEELRAARDCLIKNFWYRCVPLTVISMVATKALLSKGILTASSRFGARSKIAVAGVFGYIAGNISSMKACREKLMKIRSYPLDEQGEKRPTQFSSDSTSPIQSFTPLDASPNTEYSSNFDSSAAAVPFSSSMSESAPSGIIYNTEQEPEPVPEERSKMKTVTYDELRSNNRDPYHTTGSPIQRTPQRTPPEDKVTWKKDKKNKYGDVWEE